MEFILGPPPADWEPSKVEVLATVAAPIKRLIQPAGKEFERVLRKLDGEDVDDVEEIETTEEEDDESFKDFAKKHKDLHKRDMEDLYALLGLTDLRWRATNDQIKSAYRKMILLYHPDKMQANDHPEVNDEIFKKIQKAYDTLSDIKKRRTYDSTEEFDDSIPSEKAANDKEFFALFDPVFERNARFSLIQPAPRLEAKKFYDFWWNFKSWRDFAVDDEHDVDQAESRDEKRWMERQNEKHRKEMKNDERARILKLTDLAYKKDPRIKKHEEDLQEAKRKAKEQKQNEIRQKQEEEERRVAEEKTKQEQEKKRKYGEQEKQKRARKEQEQVLKQSKQKLWDTNSTFPKPLPDHEIATLCENLSLVRLGELATKIDTADNAEGKLAAIMDSLQQLKTESEERIKIEQEKARKSIEEQRKLKEEKDKPWTEDELAALAKGVAKYPGGMAKRWEAIAELVPTRTVKEVVNKIKDLKTAQNYQQKAAVVQVVNPFDKLKSKVGDKVIESPLSQRWEEESAAASSTSSSAPEKPVAGAKQAAKPAAAPAKPAAAGDAASAAATTEVDWQPAEQKLLEQGLQQFPNTLDNRWDLIAAHVKTKTKKECIARFKYLVSVLKGKK